MGLEGWWSRCDDCIHLRDSPSNGVTVIGHSTANMSEIGKKIASVVDSNLGPLLKEYGFRRRGRNFHRVDGKALLVVTIQSSQWNYGGSGKFRVNFGVHFPEVAKVLLGSDKMPKAPVETYCVLRGMWSFPDRWWQVDAATDTSELGVSLRAYWSETVSPWLEANKHLPTAAKTLETQLVGRMTAAAAHLVMGEREQASRLVRVCVTDLESAILKQSSDAANVELLEGQLQDLRNWATKHGLLS